MISTIFDMSEHAVSDAFVSKLLLERNRVGEHGDDVSDAVLLEGLPFESRNL